MKLTSRRMIAALVLGSVLIFAAAALAVSPKPGQYSNGETKHNVTFAVDGGKVLQFVVSSTDCEDGQPAVVSKELKIKKSGKFHYDGKADSQLAGVHFHVDLEGKFVSKKKAKGSFEREDCDELEFTAKYLGNAG